MRDNECLVIDVVTQHGRLQRILTVNGVQAPLVMKNRFVHLEHYYQTAKQMLEIDRDEWMTAKTMWDPSKLDDIEVNAEQLIK